MNKTILFLFSATGLLVVNNLFLYWQFFEFDLNLFLSNTIGIALFLEAFLLMLLLAYYFKHHPIGKYKSPELIQIAKDMGLPLVKDGKKKVKKELYDDINLYQLNLK